MLLTLSQVKLAEKDAQLMGGFGEMSRLRDLDDDLGIPMVTMPRSRDVSVIDALIMGVEWDWHGEAKMIANVKNTL